MDTNLKKINKIFLDGNENIVIQDIEKSSIVINKNNPEELKMFFKSFKNRATELEQRLNEHQDGYVELKTLFTEYFSENKNSVLVAQRKICQTNK